MNQHWLKLLEGKGKKGKGRKPKPRTPEHQASIDAKNAQDTRDAEAQATFNSSVAGQSQARLHQSGNTHIDATHPATNRAIQHASKTWRGHPDHDKEVDKAAVGASTEQGGGDLTVSQAKKQSFRRHRGSDPTAGATRVWAADKKPDQPRGTPREPVEDSTWHTYRNIASILSETPIVDTEGNPLQVGISPDWEKRTQTAKHNRKPLTRILPTIKQYLRKAMRSKTRTPIADADRRVKGLARGAIGNVRGPAFPSARPGENTFLTWTRKPT